MTDIHTYIYVKKNATLIKMCVPPFDKKCATLLWFASGFVREVCCGAFRQTCCNFCQQRDKRGAWYAALISANQCCHGVFVALFLMYTGRKR